ncbi:MAG: Clostripain family protein [Oscillospiraceae bacterium]|nr:Clostripain family protein [Oscillospiraceae bacterium]
MKINSFKKLFALLTAFAFVSGMTGCFGDFSDYDDYVEADVYSGEKTVLTVDPTEPIGTRSTQLSLNVDGTFSIKRSAREQSAPMADDGRWTIFVYMCGSDLESKQASATDDISEMLYGSSSDRVRYVIQTGGCDRWHNYGISADKTQRYVISDGEIVCVDELDGVNMGETESLSDFLNWGIENYASEKMGVVMWNHGGGSITGVCFDERNDFDSLSLAEIDTALTSVYGKMTEKFEFIGFDACLMATVETANMLVPHADYMFASQQTESGYGWDYAAVTSFLEANTDVSGEVLGKAVADSFYESCTYMGEEADATFSVTDLSEIDSLVTAVNTASAEMFEASKIPAKLSVMVKGITSARNYGGNNKSEGYTNMVDLGGMMDNISGVVPSAEKVAEAVNRAVVYSVNGENEKGSTGLSIYYPLSVQGNQELDIFRSVCVSPYYMTFVDKIAYGSAGGMLENYSGDDIWLSPVTDFWNALFNDSGYWADSGYGGTGDMAFADDTNLIEYEAAPHFDSNGIYTFTLTEESLYNVNGIYCSVYLADYADDGYLYELGIDNYVDVEWDSGVVKDCFDGYWYMLGDGQILAMYIVEETDDYDIFTSPVLLNGERTNLRIRLNYYEDDYDISITGAWDGIDEYGQADKTVTKLAEGDIITPVYYTYNFDGEYIDEFCGEGYVYNGDSNIYEDILPSAEYDYAFVIDDIFGSSYYTDYVTFEVDENGDIYFFA